MSLKSTIRRLLPPLAAADGAPGSGGRPAGSTREAAELVNAAYRGVLRRPPDSEGAHFYAEAIASGRMSPLDLLNSFMRSEEFAALEPDALDAYDPAADRLLIPYASPAVLALSARLEAGADLDVERFEALYTPALARSSGEVRVYLDFHHRRFRELANAAVVLMQGRSAPALMEVGASVLTGLWREFLPGAAATALNAPGLIAPEADANVHADLNQEQPPETTGLFDLVLFCEVLEHLQTDAVWVLEGLLNRLKPDGLLYLSTPNVYRSVCLAAVSERRNLQPPFPKENSGRHHHMREFCMSELLEMVTQAGGEVRAWGFSDCWDMGRPRPHERSNMVVVASRRT